MLRPPAAPIPPRINEPDPRAVVDALVRFRIDTLTSTEAAELSHDPNARALLDSDPFAFLVGVILDEGIQAERAWRGPFELSQRLGHLDPWRLQNEPDAVFAAVGQPPALHRYVEIMSRAIVDAARRVCLDYGGDAARIWAPGSTTRDVDQRLRAFTKIGQKKAAMAVEILVSYFRVDLADLTGTDIAYDIHVRRVFLRSGLAERDDVTHMVEMARRLNPERPGFIDFPAWFIGRNWCHPRDPECGRCPLEPVCAQRLGRSITH